MNQEKIGQFIADTRKQSGLTQKELAERMGISDKTISKWECGNGIPDITYLESLCEALNINVNELLSGKHTKYEIIDFVHKTIIPNGLVISLIQGVVVLARLDLPRSIGPHLASSLLALLYAVIIYLVTLLMKERLDKEA